MVHNSPVAQHRAQIRLDTVRALHEHGHSLAAYCARCRRWGALELERLIADGRGEYRFVGRTPRCRVCGEPGEWQLRPPVYRDAPAGVAYVAYR